MEYYSDGSSRCSINFDCLHLDYHTFKQEVIKDDNERESEEKP